ncbi:MAG: transcriptional repressor [Actinobacteria bacterium]|nr:transcriptional repressor [Actinomycetota bacterium]
MATVLKERTVSNGPKLNFIQDSLKNFGHKLTGPRKIILEILMDKQCLLDADEIYMEVKKVSPKVGIATIYRSLELLTKLKLICKVSAGVGKSLFMLSEDCRKDTSIYMICNNCKRIVTNSKCLNNSIKIRLKEDAEKNIFRNCKLRIDNFQIVFTGLCDRCV